MPGSHYGEDMLTRLAVGFGLESRGHVAITLVDERRVEIGVLVRKLSERGFQHIPLLQPLDLLLAHLLVGDDARHQPRYQVEAAPPGNVVINPLERDPDLPIDQ